MQQNQVGVITLTTGSRVLTPGTLVPVSKKKLFGLSGISGLIVGLIVGMGYVALQAIVSDRLRRRDEVASLLGAPVELSLRPVRHPKSRSDGWIRHAAVKPPGDVGLLASYLQRCMISQGARMTLLVIPLDDEVVPSAALAALAKRLADDGKSVLLTDLTDEGLLACGMDGMRVDDSSAIDRPRGNLQVHSPSSSQISDAPPWTTAQAEANAILTLASIDPGAGGWHLSWAKEAVILVTAGRSSAQRVNSAAALIRAAGIGVRCGVLLGADSEDESIGLLQPDSPLVRLPIEGVASS